MARTAKRAHPVGIESAPIHPTPDRVPNSNSANHAPCLNFCLLSDMLSLAHNDSFVFRLFSVFSEETFNADALNVSML